MYINKNNNNKQTDLHIYQTQHSDNIFSQEHINIGKNQSQKKKSTIKMNKERKHH